MPILNEVPVNYARTVRGLHRMTLVRNIRRLESRGKIPKGEFTVHQIMGLTYVFHLGESEE